MSTYEVEGLKWQSEGWRLEESGSDQAIWLNERGEAMVAMCVKAVPDIPLICDENLDATRDYYRATARSMDSGIVSIDYGEFGQHRAVRTVMKRRLEPHGFAFIGAWLIPFVDRFYVVRFQATEAGPTGMREVVVMMIERPKPDVEEETGRIRGWMMDPYSGDEGEDSLYTLADQEKYDEKFPDHPLSRVRKHLADVQGTASFGWWARRRTPHIKRN